MSRASARWRSGRRSRLPRIFVITKTERSQIGRSSPRPSEARAGVHGSIGTMDPRVRRGDEGEFGGHAAAHRRETQTSRRRAREPLTSVRSVSLWLNSLDASYVGDLVNRNLRYTWRRRLAEMIPELMPPHDNSLWSRPYSIFGQRFMTTVSPAASARCAAASLRTPSCI